MAKRITSDESQADEKMAAWLAQVRVVRKARADLLPLIARMPWWAQPGPTSLLADGSMSGGISWVPAIQDARPPDTTNMAVTTLIRPTEYHYRNRFRADPFGREKVRDARLAATLKKLKQRYAAQDREQKASGVWKAKKKLHDITMVATISNVGLMRFSHALSVSLQATSSRSAATLLPTPVFLDRARHEAGSRRMTTVRCWRTSFQFCPL